MNYSEKANDRYSVVMADTALKPKWRERFEFFETRGTLSTPERRAAFKALPFRKRSLINTNWLGFFFGPIYFLILGMWRRALTLIGIAFLIVVIVFVFEVVTEIDIPDAVVRATGPAFSWLCAMTANYSYYLKEVKGNNGWNPFEAPFGL